MSDVNPHPLVGEGGSSKQLENQEQGNDYEKRISKLTESLNKKEAEVIKLKIDLNANKALAKERLKEKDKAYNEQETVKLRLEVELAAAKEEVKLLNERLSSGKEEEQKEKISELEKEVNKKVEHLQLKVARIKHPEEQLSEKEKSMFTAEGSDAADKTEKELMIKQVEDLKKESERNIAKATRRIDELEEAHKEQLEEIDRLREENTGLKGTVEEQGNMKERLTELEVLRAEVASYEEEIKVIKSEEERKCAKLEEELKKKFGHIAEATKRINAELEKTHKEQVKEINRLREENTMLTGTVEEQGNMRERLTELETLFDKVAASHEEEMNDIRRKEESKRVELEEKWKRKFDDESQQRTKSHLQEINEAMEEVKKKYRDRADRLQAREKELQAQLDKLSQENKELKEHLYNREEAYSVLQDSLDRKSTASMELEKQVEDIMKHSAEKDKKIKEISERLALKETEDGELARMRQQFDDVSANKEQTIYSQQQLASELAGLRQQLDNVSANYEQLLSAYYKEQAMVTRLEKDNEKLKQANIVLMEKVKAYKSGTTPASNTPQLSPKALRRHHGNNAPPTNKPSISVRHNDESNYQVSSAHASSSGGARDEYVVNQEETHHSNRLHSDDTPNVQPLMTAEDMARLFKPKQQQPATYHRPEQQPPQQQLQGAAYNTPSLIQSEADTDNILKDLDHSRKTHAATPRHPSPVLPRRQPPSPELDSSQELPEDEKDDDDGDDNLICPKCGKQYRVGEIQRLRRHINERCKQSSDV